MDARMGGEAKEPAKPEEEKKPVKMDEECCPKCGGDLVLVTEDRAVCEKCSEMYELSE